MSEREVPPRSRARTYRVVAVVGALIIIASIIAVVVPLVITSTPEFFSRYHTLERRYVNLEDSAHEGIGCRACHETDALDNGVSLVGDFYLSIFVTNETPEFFAFTQPLNEACLSCHNEDWSTELSRTDKIPHPAHKRVAEETRVCADCHKWTAHLEPYLEKHQQMPFSGVCVAYGCHVGTKQSDQCFDCHHVLRPADVEWLTAHPQTVAETGESACLEQCHNVEQCQLCHTTGEVPEFEGLPIEVSMKAIEELHVRDDWTTEFHGEQALENRDNCLLCHVTEYECDECHRDRPAFHGSKDSWIGRHADRTDGLDDPGCLECHDQPWCEECHEQFKEYE